MKRTLLLLLYALLFSVSAVADPGDDDINPGNPNTNLPGSGTVVIRPKYHADVPVDIDSATGCVFVWATPAQPVNVRMVEMESGFTQTHTAFMPDVLQFQQQPDLVYVTVEFDGEVVLYAWHKDTHL